MRRLKTVRRPPIYPNEPSHLPCSSLTHPAAVLTPSIGVLRWIRAKLRRTVEALLAQVDRKDDELEALKARLDALVANIEHHPDDLREIDRLLAV